jgi:hypothetical protein
MMRISHSMQRHGLPLLFAPLLGLVIGAQWSCTSHLPQTESTGRVELADETGSQSQCAPEFPDQNGWYGADAAYSLPLPFEDGRTSLWLFGDSFVERPESPGRRAYPFVHNSIGLSHCSTDGRWQLSTFWKGKDSADPSAFFSPEPTADWVRATLHDPGALPYYWPLDAFLAHDALFIGLLRVVPSEPRGPFALPFRLAGTDLARVENPTDHPEQWRVRMSTLSEDPVAFPGSAFALEGDYVYAFTFLDRDDNRSPRALTRFPLASLQSWKADLSGALQRLDEDGLWVNGVEAGGMAILMSDDATEMSVHFDASIGHWLAVYTAPTPRDPSGGNSSHASDASDDPGPATVIRLRRADQLAGPWTEAEDLYAIPETVPGTDGSFDPNVFCYAAKAHPQFAPPGRLLVSYVCNLFARNEREVEPILRRLARSPDLYRARFVEIPLPVTVSTPTAEAPKRERR